MSFAALRSPTWRTAPPWREPVEGGYLRPDPALWTPQLLPGLRALYDAELGQPRGIGYVQLDGGVGDYIYTPDSPNIRITGAFEVVMRVRCVDWTPAGNQTLIGRYVTSTNLRSFRVFVNSTGTIGVAVSSDGTSGAALLSSTITPTNALPDATWIWLRVTFLPDDGAGNRVANLFTAADTGSNTVLPLSWTANGTDTDVGTAAAHFAAATAPLEVGTFNNGALERLNGRIGRAVVYDGIGGPVAADFNASDCYGDGYWHTGGYRWNLGLPKIYDRGPSALAPATFGSGSNQPRWLPWAGAPSVYVEPSSTAPLTLASRLSPFGASATVCRMDIDVTLDAYTGTSVVVGHLSSAEFYCQITSTGSMQVTWFDGTNTVRAAAVASPSWVPGRRYLLSYQVDSSTGVASFWVDGVSAGTVASGFTGWRNNAGTNTQWDLGINSAGVVAQGRRHTASLKYDGVEVAAFNAALCGQTGYTDPVSGLAWTIGRASTGTKPVVQSHAARSARGVILHRTDDWIDVPAAAVPALDTFAAASSVTASFRRWHNPGAAGHAIFTTKANAAGATLGSALRLSPTAASAVISQVASDGAVGDQADSSVDIGVRGVATIQVGSSSPFLNLRANAASGTDTARATTVSTSTGGAGRIGAYTGGTGAIDMEFEALICRDVATTDAEHGLQVAYYGGGL